MSLLRDHMSRDMVRAGLLPRTRWQYIAAIRHMVEFLQQPPEDLLPADIRAWDDEMERRGNGPDWLGIHIAALKVLYRKTLSRPDMVSFRLLAELSGHCGIKTAPFWFPPEASRPILPRPVLGCGPPMERGAPPMDIPCSSRVPAWRNPCRVLPCLCGFRWDIHGPRPPSHRRPASLGLAAGNRKRFPHQTRRAVSSSLVFEFRKAAAFAAL